MGKVVFVACTNVGRAMIEAIHSSSKLRNIELAGVVNLKPENAIEKANYDSYTDLVKRYNLNIYYCENVNEKGCVEFLMDCEPDIVIQSGWSQKFGNEILTIPRFACIGEHPAPLPKGRGAACINWAIITGEHKWGDTFFHMEEEYDTGKIYAQEFFNIEIYDDVKTVYDKVAKAAVNTIERFLSEWVKGDLNGHEQDTSLCTHYPRRKPSDGEFNFKEHDALYVYNHIRGQARPYPGAYFYIKGANGQKRKTYVWKARLGEDAGDAEVAISCKDGKNVILQRVQIEGEPEMWAADGLKNNIYKELLSY